MKLLVKLTDRRSQKTHRLLCFKRSRARGRDRIRSLGDRERVNVRACEWLVQ